MRQKRILWYFADPMCSWCWGFAPVVSAIKDAYRDDLQIALILGGLRPGTREPLSASGREEILHHWQQVQERTGQAFVFDGALPEGFVYDTEPPSRAVIALSELQSEATFSYFKSIQAAFYAEQQDVTDEAVLSAIAEQYGVEPERFQERFHAEAVAQKTYAHFYQARQAGVRGFPTVVLENDAGYRLLTHGYRSFEELQEPIDDWLRA